MLTMAAPIAIAEGMGLFGQEWPSGSAVGGSIEPPASAAACVPSDTCRWDALCVPYLEDPASRAALDLGEGWSRAWNAEWRINGAELVCPVRDLASVPVLRAAPVRHFSFSTKQRHRPGLEYVASTKAMHGFESIEEQKVLLALDFAAQVTGVLSQPFRLRYRAGRRALSHTPDLLAVTESACCVIDVRPASVGSRRANIFGLPCSLVHLPQAPTAMRNANTSVRPGESSTAPDPTPTYTS